MCPLRWGVKFACRRFGPLSFCLLGVMLWGGSVYGSALEADTFPTGAVLINFDNMTGGGCNMCGPSVTNQYAALGVVFDNPTYPSDARLDTNLTAGIPDASSTNALFVYQGGLLSDPPAAPFQLLFSSPVRAVGFDYASSTDSFLEVDAYSANGKLLETLDFCGGPTSIGLGGFAGVEESAGISVLDLSYRPNADPARTLNFSIDNLEFQQVPEPSMLSLVGVGLLAMLLACRCRP